MGVGRLVPLVCLGAAALGACLVRGFELDEPPASTTASTAGGSGGEGGGTGPAGGSGGGSCGSAKWPAPPSTADGAEDLDLIFAVRTIQLGETDLKDGPKIGFDLDDVCTCPGPDSCVGAGKDVQDRCDGPGGIDAASARLFAFASVANDSLTSSSLSTEADNGKFGLLLRISGYNGGANDDQVNLSIHPSPGFADDPCNGKDSLPAWQGDDRWPVSAGSVAATGGAGGGAVDCKLPGSQGYDVDKPTFVDAAAYVTDRVLVASLTDAGLLLPTSDGLIPVELRQGVVSARIEPAGDGYQLSAGVVTGRWPLGGIFSVLGVVSSQGSSVCTDHPLYSVLKNAVCRYPDILSSFGGPSQPCDALSFALGFTAFPARFGVVISEDVATVDCPPETDPANDTCN